MKPRASQFLESCLETAAEGAREALRQGKGRPRARKLLRVLRGKQRILVTCHRHPDPDALGSAAAMVHLLRVSLPGQPTRPHASAQADPAANPDLPAEIVAPGQLPAIPPPVLDAPTVDLAINGKLGGGVNDAFFRHARLETLDWQAAEVDARLTDPTRPDAYDAVVLLDVQPSFPYSPLPEKTSDRFPTAIIDHHRARGRKPSAAFVDIRTDVGATASIVFSYFMELDVPVPPDVAAALLYAVESDLAGAAGQPSDLDNVALANLTLLADTRRLYRMRHVSLPPHYFVSYANALVNAQQYGEVVFTHVEKITSLETPAIVADFLLRLDSAQWCVVTALVDMDADGKPEKLLVSARTGSATLSAGEAMRRAMDGLGEGGGHRTKAGGFVRLETGSHTEVDRVRGELRRRFLSALKVTETRGRRLIDPVVDAGRLVRFETGGGVGG